MLGGGIYGADVGAVVSGRDDARTGAAAGARVGSGAVVGVAAAVGDGSMYMYPGVSVPGDGL